MVHQNQSRGSRFEDTRAALDEVVIDTEVVQGHDDPLFVKQVELNNTFLEILEELKKITIYLAIITDSDIVDHEDGE